MSKWITIYSEHAQECGFQYVRSFQTHNVDRSSFRHDVWSSEEKEILLILVEGYDTICDGRCIEIRSRSADKNFTTTNMRAYFIMDFAPGCISNLYKTNDIETLLNYHKKHVSQCILDKYNLEEDVPNLFNQDDGVNEKNIFYVDPDKSKYRFKFMHHLKTYYYSTYAFPLLKTLKVIA
jgi:hypothetical protein